jgi:dihydrodipicolinate synthase/N-acetylneuraminate lyase
VLTKDDIKGVAAMVPTPCKENGEGWNAADSVDLDEAALMTEKYVRDGIGVIAACGTTGECAALLWEEKAGLRRRHRSG